MSFTDIFAFLGGLGFFLYGMTVMAEGLQRVADTRMRKLLEVLTTNKFYGVLVGAFVTMIIQSSSATTVMVVGFVNAGLMNLSQAIGVIMGANIGTTITAWIVAMAEWSQDLIPLIIAPAAVAIGSFFILFSKKDKTKQIGQIIIGFGILFIGMTQMSSSVEPLRELEAFRSVFLQLGSNPILGILAGAGVTAIIQSSSASVTILQALALSGLIPWNAAVYIIMGQNIGTCITALLSSIGASKNAKGAAYIHLLFNIIGSIIFSIVAVIYFNFINVEIGQTLITVTQISIVHTAFNIANTLVLYNFSDYIIKIAEKLTSHIKEESDEVAVIHLDDRILETPSFAIQSCIKEISRLGEMSLESLELAEQAMFERNKDKIKQVFKREKMIDSLENAIIVYLVKISKTNITKEEYDKIASLFKTANDFERVGDHCENIVELIDSMLEDNVYFSDEAINELKNIFKITKICLETSVSSLEHSSLEDANKVINLEQEIDDLEQELRRNHLNRLANNECNSTAGVVLLDTLSNLERIGDHSMNVAQAVIINDF